MLSYLEGAKFDEPFLLFDRMDTSARNRIPFRGLSSHGPYDKNHTKIRTVLLTPVSELSKMGRLIDALNDGSGVFSGGFRRFFRSRLEVIQTISLSSSSFEEYQNASNEIIKMFDPKDIDIVLCFIPFTSRYITNTPYYLLKAIFSSQGIPSQMVTHRVFTNFDWSLLNLAIAIFAKSGGVPWVLAEGNEKVDMIVGISMSNRITARSRAGERPRYVGCVNIFDRFGRWLFFEGTASLYNEDRYSRKQQLEELFSNCIVKYKSVHKNEPRNIVLHYYKKFSRFEVVALEELLDNLLDEHSLACVSINSSHPYRVYDKMTPDGSFPRGAYVKFGENGYLLSTTGATEMAGRRMGTPKLQHIQIRHMTDEFTTKEELVKTVFDLTKLNWGTSVPMVRDPITLTFSEALAYLTAVLNEEDWGNLIKTQVNPTLSRRPWFI